MARERPLERTNNNTTRADFQSVGEVGRGEALAPALVDDIYRPGAPSPTPMPSTSFNTKMSLVSRMVSSLFSRRAGSRRAVWGNSDSAPPTAPSVTSSSVEEQFPPFSSLSSSTVQSVKNACTKAATSRATPRFSLPTRRRKSPVALDDSKTVTMVDASLTVQDAEEQCLQVVPTERSPPTYQSVPINDYLHLIWSGILNELGIDPDLFFPMSAPFSTTQLIVDVSGKSSTPTALTALPLSSSSSINSSVSNNANDDDKNNGDTSRPSGAPVANPPVPPPPPEPPPDAIVGDNAYTGEQSPMSIPMALRIPSSAPSNPTPTQTHVASRRR